MIFAKQLVVYKLEYTSSTGSTARRKPQKKKWGNVLLALRFVTVGDRSDKWFFSWLVFVRLLFLAQVVTPEDFRRGDL